MSSVALLLLLLLASRRLLLPLLLLPLLLVPPPLCAALELRGFVGCAVREFSFVARKPGCRGVRITTDACWGRCETWEKPTLEPPFVEAHHRVCTYNETRPRTVRLPMCRANVDPHFTFPVAVSCECQPCSAAHTACETF
ncbi:glycoprotein hormone beta-5-like [Lethenteron reissneri]|uniref:glycoprotein hormone beta-5-like n=1 Tax=Lethenteron reissneri TaxID=7753 RepID=UPI002AB7C95F|nr:glycoprotein hormone beta-5-like [Lethenteron reissneri]